MALISVAELSEQIDEPDLVVCDLRFHLDDHARGRREYDAAHLPSAQFVDLHTELAGSGGGGRHPLPAVADFLALIGRLGVQPGSLVVAYDDAAGATASRLWWMLRSIGRGRTAVLDGGIDVKEVAAITDRIESRLDNKVADIHVWRVGPADYAAIVSIVTHYPQKMEYYKELLSDFESLSHVTIEIHTCGGEPCVVPPRDGA